MAEKRNLSRIQPPVATHQTSGTQLIVACGIPVTLKSDLKKYPSLDASGVELLDGRVATSV
jgi:hypothetical protein